MSSTRRAVLFLGLIFCCKSVAAATSKPSQAPGACLLHHASFRFPCPHFWRVADAGRPAASKQDETRMLLGGALSGAMAGSLTQLVLHPIDTVKTRLQVRGVSALRLRASNVRALYAGVASNVLGEMPSSALFYATYELLVRKLSARRDHDGRALVHLAAAAAASVVSSVIRVPSEVVKTQLQTGRVTGNRATVLRIVRGPGGWRGLFAGYGPFLLRDVPFDAIQFMTYDALRCRYRHWLCPGRDPRRAEDALLGAAAGGLAGALTTPFDVVRAELMVAGIGGGGGGGAPYARMREVALDIVRKEGAAGLMRGVWARVGWLAAGGCVFFPALEGAKKMVHTWEGPGAAEQTPLHV